MKPTHAKALSLLAAVLIPVASANATIIVFPLDGGEGSTSFTTTVSGVTLTVDNPTPDHISAVPNFYLQGADYAPSMTGFSFHFDADVFVTGYTVGFVSQGSTGAYIDLTGPNGNALNNSIASGGTFSPSSSFFLFSGESGVLASTFPNPAGFSELLSITVDTGAVPEPATWTLFAGALAGVVALRFRRGHQPRLE